MKKQDHSLKPVLIPAFVWILFLLIAAACQPFEPEALTIIETGNVSDIGWSSCVAHGEILDIGEEGITQHGFVWSDSPNPTIASATHSQLGPATGTGSFEFHIRELSHSTTYYIRSYATGGGEIVFGNSTSFQTITPGMPVVTTSPVVEITDGSAVSGGVVTDNGGAEIIARGVCWSLDPGPTVENNHTMNGTGIGKFSSAMESLEPYTDYYVRAYASNEAFTGYGEELIFSTLWNNAPVYDFEENGYPTVQIGWMVWTVMNIRSTKYSDGTPIPMQEGKLEWEEMPVTDKAFCFYENNPGLAEADGALYTWAAATNGHTGSHGTPSGVQGVCPAGWHLPSDEEWKLLELVLGMPEEDINSVGWRGTVEGGMLKEAGMNWIEPNVEASNTEGFNARPSGMRVPHGDFGVMGTATFYWSSTDAEQEGAWFRQLQNDNGGIHRDGYPRKFGFSVRCVKDY